MHLFTYGSLMFPAVWRALVHGEYQSSTATLNGFIRRQVQGDTYPAVIAANTTQPLRGRLYFDINHADMQRLDAFEGEYYLRQTVPVTLPDSRVMEAAVYVLKEAYRHLLSDEAWDVEWFEREGIRRFLADYKGFVQV